MRLYDFKWALIIFLFGAILQFVGALFKIRHWPMADEMITISTIICVIAVIIAIIKILALRKENHQ